MATQTVNTGENKVRENLRLLETIPKSIGYSDSNFNDI